MKRKGGGLFVAAAISVALSLVILLPLLSSANLLTDIGSVWAGPSKLGREMAGTYAEHDYLAEVASNPAERAMHEEEASRAAGTMLWINVASVLHLIALILVVVGTARLVWPRKKAPTG